MRALLLLAVVLVAGFGCVKAATPYDSKQCTEDADCELVTPCCACCQEVAMTRVDAQLEHDRCTQVECRTECVSSDCVPTNHKAACRAGACTAVPQ
ncbi:MAG: hypothetical protein U0228_35415 [Myxococcaceae bacterium]